MARKKVWTKQDYTHRALTTIGVKMLRKGNENLIPEMAEVYIKLLELLEDEKASRVDAMEDKVDDMTSTINLLISKGELEKMN